MSDYERLMLGARMCELSMQLHQLEILTMQAGDNAARRENLLQASRNLMALNEHVKNAIQRTGGVATN